LQILIIKLSDCKSERAGLINTGKSTTAWDDINGIPDRKKFTEKANQILPQ
jgi:hypothetical protein